MPDRPILLAADNPRVRLTARWLVLCTALLILYGSLFPFRFTPHGIGLWPLITQLDFARTSRGDIVANLLLYMPLGLFLMLAWPATWGRWKGLLIAVLIGSLLSFGVEVAQGLATTRVSSLTDLLLNAAGTTLGALIAIGYLALGSTIRMPGAVAGRPDPVPFGLLVLWLAFRLAPFVPTIDWQKYKEALKPLLDPQFKPRDVFAYVVGWLVAGYAVRRVWRREFALQALAVIVFVVLFGRVVVVGKALSVDEITALVICIPCALILTIIPDRRRALLLVMLLAAVISIEGLEPFELLPEPHAFSWVPFINSLSDNLEVNYSVLLEKSFWYFALIWLLTRRGFGVAAATLVTVILLTGIEVTQMWIPTRSAEITDPLLAICGGILIALGTRRQASDVRVGELRRY
jgi:glycopeptide antibiotics resistance protein